MIELKVVKGPQAGAVFRMDDESFGLGRSRSNEVILQDDRVSSRHASIVVSAGKTIIRDLNSTNGTLVNGLPVEAAVIKNGDRIVLGSTQLIFSSTDKSAKSGTSVKLVSHLDAAEPTIHEMVQSDRSAAFDIDPGQVSMDTLVNAHRNLKALYRVNSVLNSTFDLHKLFDRIMDQIFLVTRADRGVLMVIDEKTGELEAKVVKARDQQAPESLNISRTIINKVLERGSGILTSDAMSDTRFSSGESVMAFHIRSAMCVPIRSKDRTTGIIYVDTKMSSGQFKRSDLELLTALGNEAGVAIENTMLYEANVRAERLAALGEALAGLSHYIKNILMCMQGGGQLVQKALDDKNLGAIGKGWGIVRRNERKLSELVMDMLSYCKEREPLYEKCNIGELLQDMIDLSMPLIDEKSVSIETNFAQQTVVIEADAEALNRCLLNVLSNAIDAVQPNTGRISVRISLDEEAGEAGIVIGDNGCGIPPEMLPKIFDAFCSTKGSKGTGLGLAVSHKMLQEHGGSIAVESNVGEGSTFTITLPAHPAQK